MKSDQITKLLSALVAIMALVSGVGKYYLDKQEAVRQTAIHEAHEEQQRTRDREHIRQLERIVISEFPKWTAAISWDDK